MKEHDVARLFEQLDVNKDGCISVLELSKALKRSNHPNNEKQAAELMRQADTKSNMSMNFAEFLQYVEQQDRKLRIAFSQLDRNKDERVDAEEIQLALSDLGVNVDKEEAQRLLAKMDTDNSLKISYDEWRDFLLLTGTSNVTDIFTFWRHASAIDIGENFVIPDDYSKEEKSSGVVYKTLIAGGIAGAVSRTCTAPLDRLKVLWQAQAGSKHSGKHSGFQTLRNMIVEGGITSLWRGNGINCLKIGPEMALKFMTYEKYKWLLTNGVNRDVTLLEKFVAGALAGATSQTLIYPMELLKTRMCLRKTDQYSSIFDCANKAYNEGGLKVFYRGCFPNLLGILPYAGIDLALYETFKKRYFKYSGTDSQSAPVYVTLIAGAISSVCGQVTTYPLALVRTKMQASSKNLGMLSMFTLIIKHEGPLALYRGLGPNFVKVVPSVSISYGIFEEIRNRLGLRQK